MNKIICDVCGTDYPETAAQCPICGCAGTGAQTTAGNEVAEAEEKTGYVPVKGGRYSKANVRKRLKANQVPYDPMAITNSEPEYEDDDEQDEAEEEEQGSNRGLIIVVVILLLAIVAVASYIAISIFGIGFDKLPTTNNKPSINQNASIRPTTDPTTTTADNGTMACVDLAVSDVDIYLNSIGSVWALTVTPVPANTTDEVLFQSLNPDVATVDEFGLVTAVGNGSTSIRITCGNVLVEVPVVCESEEIQNTDPTDPTDPEDPTDATDPEDPTDATDPDEEPDAFMLTLKSKDFTLKAAGATYVLYDGEVDASKIVWSTDDAEVVTIEKGVVTAVGNGRTRVYGEYADQKVSCWVSVKLPETQVTEPEGTDPEEGTTGSYTLMVDGHISPYGDQFNAEVTITVGEEFRLTVEDDAGVRQDVTWTESKEGICSINGRIIIGESKGKVTLTATIGGKTYKCVIFVR